MKKSLLALAVLGAFAGAASAQSSVTLYGTVDLSGKYTKNDGSGRRLSLSQDGINSSQLGFRGVEDLGGGLKAGFNLLAGVNADTGSTNAKFFNRRSTVSLFSPAGELRLGRDYTPTFWNDTIFDAFGTNGLGDSSHVLQLASGDLRPCRQRDRLLPAVQPRRPVRPGDGRGRRRRNPGSRRRHDGTGSARAASRAAPR